MLDTQKRKYPAEALKEAPYNCSHFFSFLFSFCTSFSLHILLLPSLFYESHCLGILLKKHISLWDYLTKMDAKICKKKCKNANFPDFGLPKKNQIHISCKNLPDCNVTLPRGICHLTIEGVGNFPRRPWYSNRTSQ